jgi:hypothetical protein
MMTMTMMVITTASTATPAMIAMTNPVARPPESGSAGLAAAVGSGWSSGLDGSDGAGVALVITSCQFGGGV